MSSLVECYQALSNELTRDNLHRLEEVYAPEVRFIDPLHEMTGIEPLRAYLARLYDGVESCEFVYGDVIEAPGAAMLAWTMRMRHRTFRRGETLELPGVSHLKFGERIHFHRDYFDVGAMIYERVPLLGAVVRAVKARM